MLLLLFFFCISSNEAFYHYYPPESLTFNISAMGTAKANFGFLYGRFRDEPTGDYYWGCDTARAWPYWKCDIRVYMYVLIFGKLRHPVANYVELILKYMETRIIRRRDLAGYNIDVSDDGSYDYPDDSNIVGPSPVYTYESRYYYQTIAMCYLVGDREATGHLEYLTHTCRYAMLNSKVDTLYVPQVMPGLYINANAFTSFKCSQNYYQPSCWRHCVPVNNKFFCLSDGSEHCLTYWEPLQHTYNYEMPMNFFDWWSKQSVILSQCVFWNHCALAMANIYNHCRGKDTLCYPIGNGSAACLKFYPLYKMPSFPSINFTYRSIINSEYITVSTVLVGNDAEIVLSNSRCKWECQNYDDRDVDVNTNPDILKTFERSTHRKLYMDILCDVGDFRFFKMYREIVIHEKPRKFSLDNTSLGRGVYIYIGQVVKCSTDAVPQKLTVHILSLNTDNFVINPSRPFKHIIEIPSTAATGHCVLNCSFEFKFTDSRPFNPIFNYWMFYISAFVKFGWITPYKNVYYNMENAGCDYLAYFIGILSIIQRIGPMRINIEPVSNFTIFSSVGGIFIFQCSLMVQHTKTTFHRVNTFEIFKVPTTLCLVLTYHTYGSFLRCAHNAYPADQVTYLISLKSPTFKVIESPKSYIRIPFFSDKSQIIFNCCIIYAFKKQEVVLQIQRLIDVNDESSVLLGYSDTDIECARNAEPFIDNAVERGQSTLVITNEIFELSINPLISEELLNILAVIYNVLPVCAIIFFLLIRAEIETTTDFKKIITRRDLNDKLMNKSRMMTNLHGSVIDFFNHTVQRETEDSIIFFLDKRI